MRPYPDELLALMRKSLRSAVTPNVTDEWGRYVAKSLERMLEHLEMRWRHELRFLATDTEEMRELFAKLRLDLAEVRSGGRTEVADALAAVDCLLVGPSLASRAVDMAALNAENEAHRAALERLIDVMAIDDDEWVESARKPIHAYLRQQLDRDVMLAKPTFMQFGPPAASSD